MKNNRRAPCKECPFRKKSPGGWLGGHLDAKETLREVHGENGFPCHMDVAANPDGEHEQCAGAIIHANKTFKCYRNPDLFAHQQKLKSHPTPEEILDVSEFLEHHKLAAELKKKKH